MCRQWDTGGLGPPALPLAPRLRRNSASSPSAALRPQDGKTPIDLADNNATATLALLRNPPPQSSSSSGAAMFSAAAVPSDVATLLASLSLSQHGPALVTTLGLAAASDVALLTDADLEQIGMKPLERRKLLAAAAPAAAAVPAEAPPGCDVMISYRVPETGAGGDKSVFALQKMLEARGYSVFVGEAAIEGGSSWPSTIQKGVEDCRAFVVLCSASYGDAAASPWTKRELELADNLKKPLVPVWHSGPYPPRAVAIYLGGTQRIPTGDFREGYAKAKISHEKVAEELAAALARAGVPSRNKLTC